MVTVLNAMIRTAMIRTVIRHTAQSMSMESVLANRERPNRKEFAWLLEPMDSSAVCGYRQGLGRASVVRIQDSTGT
jgi:hypothetical protein